MPTEIAASVAPGAEAQGSAAPLPRITLGSTLLLGLLSAVGPVSTDMYLPAFSIIDHEFHRIGGAQLTLAAWFLGLAAGQLAQGTLSDRMGRRLPLLVGTLVYAVASAGCAMAPTLGSFCAFRLLAAFSASASMVIPRAVVRDIAHGIQAARLMSRLTLVVGVVPIAAPAVGGLLLGFMSWRDLFWAASVYGVIGAVLVWRFLPDTLPPERRLTLSIGRMLLRYGQIGREKLFATASLQTGFTFAALFAYISGSASVYTHWFGLTPAQYGLLFGLNAAGFIGATQFSAAAASRWSIGAVMRFSSRMVLGGFSVAALLAWTRVGGLPALAVPIFIGQSFCGLMAPLCTITALSRHRDHAGSASALLGTLQFGLAAIGGWVIGAISNGTPRPMTALMVALALCASLADSQRPRAPIEA